MKSTVTVGIFVQEEIDKGHIQMLFSLWSLHGITFGSFT